jgi:N-acyl-phosphatidylethanolamine-hydrolysing phospholipase D
VRSLSKSNGVKKWCVPLGTKSLLVSYGCDPSSVVEMSWWEEHVDSGSGLLVVCCPAQHWCCRRPWDRNKRLWATWAVLSTEPRGSTSAGGGSRDSFFFAGDTGYPDSFPLFKQIGEKYGPFTMSAIPIGAYAPRWFMKGQHCDPKGSLDIHSDVRSSLSIGIHWGTFPLAEELFFEPVSELVEEAERRGIGNFVATRIGESVGTGETIEMRSVFEGLMKAAVEGCF